MNVLIIGLGSIGQKHLNALKAIDSTLHVFALRSQLNSNEMEGVVNLYDLEEVKKNQFDFCIISTPTSHHKSDIEKLISLEFPLFIEKPLYHNLTIRKTVEELNLMNTKTYVACNLRFLDCLGFMQKELENNQNQINEVSVYCGSYLPEWRINKNYKEIYSAIPELGGGVHLDLIHEIDYVFWLFGKPSNVQKTLASNSSIDIKSIDYAHYLMEYNQFYASITLNYFRRDAKRTLDIVCAKGTYEVNLLANEVRFNGEIVFSSNQTFLETYESQLKYFIQNINKTTFNDTNEALEVLRICLNE